MILTLRACLTFLLVLLARAVQANTEKVIFQAPPFTLTQESAVDQVNFADRVLSPEYTSIRTSLPVAFPTTEAPRGSEYWYLLRHLSPEQRYEVRVCWAAIQPTEFWLNVFEVDKLNEIPHSLRAALRKRDSSSVSARSDHTSESILALRIQAAADFYSSNRTLMQHPPPVDVDIILDPYLGNVFPASLLPTAAYIITLAVVGWYVSGIIWTYLLSIGDAEKPHTD